MELKDLFDLLEKLETRVNAYWNFYSVGVFAIAGWLVVKDKALARWAVLFIGLGMSAAFLGNLAVIRAVEKRIAAVEAEIRETAASSNKMRSTEFRELPEKWPNTARTSWSIAMHVTIDLCMLALLCTRGLSRGSGAPG